MTDPRAVTDPPDEREVVELRHLVDRATATLLGDAIAAAEADWRGPSRLPGWSRGHLATHLARNADALGRLVDGALTDTPATMYDSPEARDAEIVAGADRTGSELYVDLDTSASQFDARLDRVAPHPAVWDRLVTLRGGTELPVRMIPCLRLAEVVLHHVDLDVDVELGDLDPVARWWTLRLTAARLAGRLPAALLITPDDGGGPLAVPGAGERVEVGGGTAELLGWLSGRTDHRPTGTDGWDVPAL